MSKLVVSIPKMGLTPKADDSRELYIIAFSSDLNIAENKEEDVIGGSNVTLPVLAPDLAKKDAMKYTLAAVSNIFPVSRSKPNANLFGSGIMIYPNLDPKGFFALQLFVIESDDNHRRLGKILSSILDDKEVKKVVDGITGAITQPIIAGVMRSIASVVPKVFENSIDDLMATAGFSGFDFDNYGLGDGVKTADFPVQDRKGIIEATIRVRVNE